MSYQKRIACFGHTIDPFFFTADLAHNLVVLIPSGNSALKVLYNKHTVVEFPLSNKKSVDECGDDDLLSLRAVQSALIQSKATHFLISHRSKKEVFTLCETLRLIPIGNNHTWATKLENKRYFDNLLIKLSLPKPKTVSLKQIRSVGTSDKAYVVQELDSFGSFGTKILTDKKSIEQFFSKLKKAKVKQSFLAREFIAGPVFGITILSQKKNAVFSALRRQCYYPTGNSTDPLFAGIQWISKSDIPDKARVLIEKSFQKLTQYLQTQNIFGLLNFDFIVAPDGTIAILECNPRPSSATPQLLRHPELLHGVDLTRPMLSYPSQVPDRRYIPSTTYSGALFDLMAGSSRTTTKGIIPARSKIHKITADLFFYSGKTSLSAIKKGDFLGMILSEKALFTKEGSPTRNAEKIYKRYCGFTFK